MNNLMDCSKVYLKSVPGKGASTFARVAIKEGEKIANKFQWYYHMYLIVIIMSF